jgi:hypothetical protein
MHSPQAYRYFEGRQCCLKSLRSAATVKTNSENLEHIADINQIGVDPIGKMNGLTIMFERETIAFALETSRMIASSGITWKMTGTRFVDSNTIKVHVRYRCSSTLRMPIENVTLGRSFAAT